MDRFTDIFVSVVCCAYLNTVDARMCPKQIRMAVNLAGALTFCWFLPQQKEQCKDWAEECHRRLLDDFFQQFSTGGCACYSNYLFSSKTAHVWLAADCYSYVRTYLCSKQSLVKLAGWSFQRSYPPILSYKYILYISLDNISILRMLMYGLHCCSVSNIRYIMLYLPSNGLPWISSRIKPSPAKDSWWKRPSVGGVNLLVGGDQPSAPRRNALETGW